MTPEITIEEVAEICASTFAAGSEIRSPAYQEGFLFRLQRVASAGEMKSKMKYREGTAEWDAYFLGFKDAVDSIDVFVRNKKHTRRIEN